MPDIIFIYCLIITKYNYVILYLSVGIILSEAPRSNEGVVLAVGPGLRGPEGNLFPMNVAVGDKVYLPEYGGVRVNGEGSSDQDGEYTIYREDELLGTLSPEA